MSKCGSLECIQRACTRDSLSNICIHCAQNPGAPLWAAPTSAGVASLDWAAEAAGLLAVGLLDGTVAVYDARSRQVCCQLLRNSLGQVLLVILVCLCVRHDTQSSSPPAQVVGFASCVACLELLDVTT